MTLSEIDRPRPWVSAVAAAHPQDQRWLRAAVAAALLLHVGVLLVPLPSPTPSAPPEPPEPGPALIPATLKPPESEPPPPRQPVQGERQLPVPDPDAPDEFLEPASEPAEIPAREGAPEIEIVVPPAEPPPISGPLAEGTLGLVPPIALPGREHPVYPEVARRARLEGTVVLKAIVDRAGQVVSIRVVGEPPVDVGFTEAAIAAVRNWRYEPGRYGGEPVAVEITVVVEFVLN